MKERMGVRAPWGVRLLQEFAQDAQYALRAMRRSRGFTAIATISLALGIGANTAIFSLMLVTLDARQNRPVPSRYHEAMESIARIPGVTAVSLAGPSPLSGAGASGFATVDGFEEKPADRRWTSICYVSPNYFATLGIPLTAGRDFHAHDEANWKVAILNRAFAQYYFAGRDPIGQRVTLDHVTGEREAKTYVVIGLAGNANYSEISEAPPRTIYLPALRGDGVEADNLIVRTGVDPESVARNVQRATGDVWRAVPVLKTTTLSKQVDASIFLERLIAALSDAFGVAGLILAGVGLYGLLAYTVARRTNEIGIRLALGANPGDIARMVLIETFVIVAGGLMVGGPLALVGSRLAAMLVPEMMLPGAAPLAIGATVVLLGALAASYAPASKAAHVNPVEALRHE